MAMDTIQPAPVAARNRSTRDQAAFFFVSVGVVASVSVYRLALTIALVTVDVVRAGIAEDTAAIERPRPHGPVDTDCR